ncbi:MAG: 23S rRNA (uracil(1939)-C(5))-methyltransferase RlmD [Deltaproteobacteria bacterium]|nr:23S rRNA (uracil(1939)-C(5))-methyltransferase RlmD [Deltaproteobacteria bacterium]
MIRKRPDSAKDRDKRKTAPPRSLVGEVEPLALGASGLVVGVGKKRFAIAAAAPGDHVRIRPRPLPPEARRAVMSGELPLAERLAVETPGPQRVLAPCSLLSRCGGCALQELAYPAQVTGKEQALKALLLGLEVETKVVEATVVHPLSRPYGYRTKLTMSAGGKAGSLRFGFYARGNFEPLGAEGCPVQHPLTLATLAQVRQVLDGFRVAPSLREERDGWLHGMAIRVEPENTSAELTLVGRDAVLPRGEALTKALGALPLLESVYLSVNPKRSSYLLGDEFLHLAGGRRMRFSMGGQKLSLSPGSFLQTCHEGGERLVERVLALLPERIETLVDLYGGVGIFARASAERWQRATVVESSPYAIADLQRAIQRKQAPKLDVVEGRVEENLDAVLKPSPEVVIVDPPRRGCHSKVINALCKARPSVLVYVACGADSFTRDAKMLMAKGYTLDHVEGVDMFPHTTHLEIVARFRDA